MIAFGAEIRNFSVVCMVSVSGFRHHKTRGEKDVSPLAALRALDLHAGGKIFRSTVESLV